MSQTHKFWDGGWDTHLLSDTLCNKIIIELSNVVFVQFPILFKSWGGNKFELPHYILVDSVPDVDLPVLFKLFRAVEVRSALPLVIVGLSSLLPLSIIINHLKFQSYLLDSPKIFVSMNVVIIPRMSIIGRLSLAKLFYFQTLIWPLSTGIL